MLSPAWIKGIVGLSLVVTVATTATIGLPKKPTFKTKDEEWEYRAKKYCGHLETDSNPFYDCLNEFDEKFGLEIHNSWKNKNS